jgi:DNA-binding PadR family transcriptional regulator
MDISVPLKPAALHILLALAERESHGYAIMQTVREQSGGRVPLQTGSFYRHLGKLMDAGLVAEAVVRHHDAEKDDPRRGTYYRLTPHGKRLLLTEKKRLGDLVAAMDGLRATTRRGRA